MNPSSFHIYDASAGSGKTFTLVKEYLKVLFRSNKRDPFKYILAITFTNKAVGEMKERIIDTLKKFSSPEILSSSNIMFKMICEELNIKPDILHQKAKDILERIVHNYAAFDVSTIDKFNQRLIRTFAYDLKLPLNFEVELDTDTVLSEAVDNLIAKAGTDKKLTKILVDFAIEKADDDKSWDLAFDFNNIAKLLANENDRKHVTHLKDKTLDDFSTLKKNVSAQLKITEKQIVTNATKTLELISESGLEYSDFSRSTLPNHFIKASNLNFSGLYSNKLEENLAEQKGLYSSKLEASLLNVIETILPQIETNYLQQKQLVFKYKLLNAISKNITPLSVLNSINKEVQTLKEEQNMLLISEFNSIISDHIKLQPAPFIYERIGEKFKYYFIDEFQDTSIMQWENLIPLIDNAISGENASAILVGDAKQAIYRWRGGKAEQFIELSNHHNPFQVEKKLHHLEENRRSFKTVVDFNNQFFSHLTSFVFQDDTYKALYQKSHQNVTKSQEGYVDITFLDPKDQNKDKLYPEQVLKTVNYCLDKGFKQKEICILVRKKKEGVAISNYLNEHSAIKIMSSETLLIAHSPEVKFITDLLQLILEPNNNQIKVAVLNYLAEYKLKIKNKHHFFESLIEFDLHIIGKHLETYGIYFNHNNLLELSLYEAIETIIHDFNLVETSNAYVQYFLDFVLDYMQKKQSSILGFLEYYHSKKEKLSIVTPETIDAVQIMTIHKAKGLEFPVVIFPYAHLDMYKEVSPKSWFPLNPETFNGFSHLLINYNKDIEHFNDQGASIYAHHQAELELDNINILYVALTRAVEQLYIISEIEYDTKGTVKEPLNKYSGLFINYLKHQNIWSDNQLTYTFGSSEKKSETKENTKQTIEQNQFISTPKKDLNINVITNSGFLWDTKQEEAIEKGNLIHLILSLIKTKVDIDFAFNQLLIDGKLNTNQSKELKPIIKAVLNHAELSPYFSSEYVIYNEQDIISKNGTTIRPDRLVITKNNEAVLIDYKTGAYQDSHRLQLLNYKSIIEDMNIIVSKSILIYINTTIEITYI